MSNIQFIQVTPQDLAEIITEAVIKRLDAVSLNQTTEIKEAPKEILTRQDTAKLLSVDVKTIDNRVKAGILKKYSVGKRSYFKYSEVIQTLESSNVA